jgi:hypothetical protein
MASERQIVANRRNAQKSTGPKTESGKKRASKNAYRHGLSLPISYVGSEAQFKDLSRQFAENASDAKILAEAERAADGRLDLVRIRNARTAMIENALKPNAAGTRSSLHELGCRVAQSRWQRKVQELSLTHPESFDLGLPGGNAEEGRRFVNAVQRILPELVRTCRYEKRAAGRRDRAIRKIASCRTAN